MTIAAAASHPYTLKVMSWVALIFTPFVLLYQTWTYIIFKRRVGHPSPGEISSSVPAQR
jgi:cytochrome d ubiquinol oxidase subunit II